ncbi:hypothetical protein cypCar_00028863 [Cyprinus carpio]|nr:hypothetical protein cypCar_00028863 [Cyprinus carpio]
MAPWWVAGETSVDELADIGKKDKAFFSMLRFRPSELCGISVETVIESSGRRRCTPCFQILRSTKVQKHLPGQKKVERNIQPKRSWMGWKKPRKAVPNLTLIFYKKITPDLLAC